MRQHRTLAGSEQNASQTLAVLCLELFHDSKLAADTTRSNDTRTQLLWQGVPPEAPVRVLNSQKAFVGDVREVRNLSDVNSQWRLEIGDLRQESVTGNAATKTQKYYQATGWDTLIPVRLAAKQSEPQRQRRPRLHRSHHDNK